MDNTIQMRALVIPYINVMFRRHSSSPWHAPALHPALAFLWWQHDDIFPLTVAEFHQIAAPQLNISPTLYLLPIQNCPISTLQVQQVRPNSRSRLPVLARLGRMSELHYSMLPAATRVSRDDINDFALSSKQPHAFPAQFNGIQHIPALENEHSPCLRRGRFAGFGRLVVFENDIGTDDEVRLASEETRVAVVGFLFGNRLVVWWRRQTGTRKRVEGLVL